jgi:hypothetical protein
MVIALNIENWGRRGSCNRYFHQLIAWGRGISGKTQGCEQIKQQIHKDPQIFPPGGREYPGNRTQTESRNAAKMCRQPKVIIHHSEGKHIPVQEEFDQ